MRILKFIVDGQTIRPDPSCNFNDLYPGMRDYVRLEFSFSSEWRGRAKVVSFWSMLGDEYEPRVLTNGSYCNVPTAALARRAYKIQVLAKGSDGSVITTQKFTIQQRGGKS